MDKNINKYHGYEKQWKVERDLPIDHRLIANIPFVAGGEFVLSNIMSIAYSKHHYHNANIARQLVGVPNGTKVKIVVKKNRDDRFI
ncbi:hypothetical protein [Chitinophaga ginsengisoli]|uniref:Uncharacterized protein n=1 Tax=Chitinophaga ginsengisoli TaxID=363837 RepID=A0A2P8G2A3_9BACT|nr:hypothetical protein [Chitinophaga ginsengisoli]PSL28114.1 hypothetical protein CLV42_10833 [Chitinophaga ginsengisoli]